MAEGVKPVGKVRHCPYCGDDMGFIENRYFDRLDPCGKQDCQRDAWEAYAEEREAAHDEVDDRFCGGC